MASKGRSDWLKVFGMGTMLIDHAGLLLFANQPIFRMIGRLSFPIFAFGIARGFKYTKDRKRYIWLLFLFGALSQPPFMWLHSGTSMNPYQINQLWQFLYSIGVLFVVERAQKSESISLKIIFFITALTLAFLPDVVRYYDSRWSFSFGTYGVLMSVLFYLFEGKWFPLVFGYGVLSYFYGYWLIAPMVGRRMGDSFLRALMRVKENVTVLGRFGDFFRMEGVYGQSRSFFALPFIRWSERAPGKPFLPRLVAYIFYPAHIALLLLIRWIVF